MSFDEISFAAQFVSFKAGRSSSIGSNEDFSQFLSVAAISREVTIGLTSVKPLETQPPFDLFFVSHEDFERSHGERICDRDDGEWYAKGEDRAVELKVGVVGKARD